MFNRVIPCLLLSRSGLVKTIKFKDPTYVGDPINAVKIFNEKQVDELIFLDIDATQQKKSILYQVISDIASECFMPFAYGGGIRTIEDIQAILKAGVEKVVINTAAVDDPNLIREAAQRFGSQSIIVSIDFKKSLLGRYEVHTHGGRKATGLNPVQHAVNVERLGAGEIFLNSIDRDGAMKGYDLSIIREVSRSIEVPLVACGGAGKLTDFSHAVAAGASAVSAGSMFVFYGRLRAVLINYPSRGELDQVFQNI